MITTNISSNDITAAVSVRVVKNYGGDMKKHLLAAAIAVVSSAAAQANTPVIEEMTIVGSREDARALAGSGSVIDSSQIDIEAATDINQLLKTVPGMYILEEDGYGLRPNIGIRGATSERAWPSLSSFRRCRYRTR